jgi:hypothetical protein
MTTAAFILLIGIVVALGALVWCFIGFTRDLKTPPFVGLLIRMQIDREDPRRIVAFPRTHSHPDVRRKKAKSS